MAKKKSSHAATERRATWKGELGFGLVSFPVEAFNALNRQGSDVHFHQLHDKCHSRIHNEKVCPIHGRISNDDIVMGYEYEKDHYVEIAPEQLDALRTHEERSLTIDSFVGPDTIDPIYYDGRMYYLLPASKSAEQAYSVMVAAMERENCYAVGQVIFSGKQQLALIRPLQHMLHMAMLNYAAEIKLPGSSAAPFKKTPTAEKQLKLARTLIRDWWAEDFDYSAYEDTYRDKVEKLIKSKVKNRKVVVPKEVEESAPATISLMDALKKSVQRASPPSKRASPKRNQRHPA